MAKRELFKMSTSEIQQQRFNNSFKIQKIREYETGKSKV